ncbi:ATP-binding protein (plasmid) [Cyanobacterium sp. IPPAS B-1200]|uniref:ATP-binding protein n=1 Tax=Cyanobacterium sp. IPPAS B-1200 TaxID=1562720 RepID=UPI003D51D54B
MSKAYQLKSWTQVVTPHPDIREGKLDNATYAAQLGAVIRNDVSCPYVYRDARGFFEATYLTKELKQLLNDVLKGLNGQGGDRILQLRTPFGGGKTHTLISLYHVTQHRQELEHIPEIQQLPKPDKIKVLSFIGLDVDASTGTNFNDIPSNLPPLISQNKLESEGKKILTPWGYLAWQIGGEKSYALVAEQDQKRIAPGNDVLRKLFGNQPLLILMDEVLVYVETAMALVVGDSTFGKQVLTFIQRLTEVVTELPNAVMVYSLQASVQEAVGSEGVLGILDKLVSRMDAKKEPVSGDEVMRVVQKRLFADIGDINIIREIARQQGELYRKYRETFAETSREKQQVDQDVNLLVERIEYSYPFHPDLLDLMYNRWGSLPSYQRTRGALQFLATVIYYLWKNNDTSLLLSPCNVPLEDSAVRQSFFSQIGERNAYDAVFSADLISRKAKVNIVNKRFASDSPALANFNIGTRMATAIMLYSFGAKEGEERGVMEQEIAQSCLTPEIDRNIITAALSDLKEELLYLHYVGKRYRFETKANLNKLVADEVNKQTSEEVNNQIRSQLEKNLQSGKGKVVVWATDSSRIQDRLPQFQVVYLEPSWAEKSPEAIASDIMHWLEYRGNDKREYKNALAFVVPSSVQMDKARTASRTKLAIASLLEQKQKYKFSAEDIEELKGKEKTCLADLNASLRKLYQEVFIGVPNAMTQSTSGEFQNPIRLENIDLQSQINVSDKLQEKVLEALKNHVFESLTVNKMFRLANLTPEKPYLKISDLVSYFFRFPSYPKLISSEPIVRAIASAIQQGKFGYIPSININGWQTVNESQTANSQNRNAQLPTPIQLPVVEDISLISYQTSIPLDELDLNGYLLTSELIEQLREEINQKIKTQTPDEQSYKPLVTLNPSVKEPTIEPYPETTSTDKVIVEKPTNSSIEKTIVTDIKQGKQPAKIYSMDISADKGQLFEIIDVLQNLSDESKDMIVNIKVTATTDTEFDLNKLRNAVEEPLDEMDVKTFIKIN